MYLEIKPKDVQAFIPELLSNLHYESQIHGNASKEDAFKLTRIVQDNLGARPLDIESFEGTLSLILPEGIVLCCGPRLTTNRYQNHP
jgi:secreted Zn-dependent insulinase-like peptidase